MSSLSLCSYTNLGSSLKDKNYLWWNLHEENSPHIQALIEEFHLLFKLVFLFFFLTFCLHSLNQYSAKRTNMPFKLHFKNTLFNLYVTISYSFILFLVTSADGF